MTESAFNKKVQDLVEAEGGYIIKTIASNKAGVHDMIACVCGCFVSLEGKLSYNKASAIQEEHTRQIIAAGGIAMTVKTLEDVRFAINEAKRRGMKMPQFQPKVVTKPIKKFSL